MIDKQMLFSQLPTVQQELALQRFRIIQPFLEGHIPLTQLVQTQQLPLRTARRWVHHYRTAGLAGLARSVRADRGTRRDMPLEMERFIQALAQQEKETSIASLYRRVLQTATEQGWPTPSYSKVYAIARSSRISAPTMDLPPAQLLHEAQAGRPSTQSPQQLALLETKLRRPRLPTNLVRRERLFVRLDEGTSRALTVLSAPAGFGKTTLVCQWIAERDAHHQLPAVAWVSLESEDNDPLRFWRYLIVACQRLLASDASSATSLTAVDSLKDVIVPGNYAIPTLDLLGAATQPPLASSSSLEVVLTTLLNTFTNAPGGILVLEDYHVITEPQIHQAMAFLLDHLPESLHLVLITRTDPPLSLAKLRASGHLCEVRTTDLRFSLQEMQLFLQPATPFALSEDIVKRLDTRLDGWAAGLRLLSFSLQEQSSPQDFEQALTTFTGSHHPLQAYFVSEVLALQPASVQDFLMRTSILGRLTAPLCDILTGRDDSEQLLEALERTGLFLEALDENVLPLPCSAQPAAQPWYRYHALFAEAITSVARRRLGEDTLQLLARRASQWFEQQSMLPQAIEIAFQTSDMTHVVELIERFIAVPHYKQLHEYHTLFRWLQRIPIVMLKQSPALCLSYATSLLFAASADRLDPRTMALVEVCLRSAEAGFAEVTDQPARGLIFALRALIYWRQDTLPQAIQNARQALTHLPAHEVLWRGIAETILGMEALFNGQFSLARQTFQQSRLLGEQLFTRNCTALPAWTWGKGLFTQTATTLLAWTCYQQGDLRLAAEYYHQVLSETRASGERHAHLHALLGLAWISYEWNDLDQAEQQAQEISLVGKQQASTTLQVRASLLMARVLQARGEIESALKLLVELPARLQVPLLPYLEQEISAEQIRLHLALGHSAVVQRWATERTTTPQEVLRHAQYEKEILLLARFYLAQGHAQEACLSLQHLLAEIPESEHSRIGLEIQLLLALTEASLPWTSPGEHSHQGAEARQRLQTILSLTQPQGYQRLFLDEGEPMARLLRSFASHLHEPSLKTYLRQILQAFGSPSLAAPLPEPLSPQEVRVLRLLATGSSAPQIAQQLVVSVTTVRTQIQSIYRKLQVNNRVAASSAAHALHLL